MSAWRRLNNRIDRWLDRRSLHAPVESVQVLGVGGVPCLASVALERAAQQAQALDRDARLKQVLAPQGTQPDGAASRWQFHFELPRARARLAVDWYLDGDVRGGRFGHETIAVRAEPFPPSESVLAQGVADGRWRRVDVEEAAAVVLGLLDGLSLQLTFDRGLMTPSRAARVAEDALVRYLSAGDFS